MTEELPENVFAANISRIVRLSKQQGNICEAIVLAILHRHGVIELSESKAQDIEHLIKTYNPVRDDFPTDPSSKWPFPI